jgi:methylenetetrahydrofolate dehydrogenase (NADP+)/methenyltetrahydrofolate cyclohydrolase
MTQILEGKTLSAQIRSGLSARVAFCASKLGRAPKLVGISWQGDYAGFLYLNKEADAARKLGIAAEIREVDEHTTAEEFFAIVRQVSQDETVDAVLIPRPLPPALNNLDIAPFLNPAQDIDGSGLVSMGRLFMCKSWDNVLALDTFVSCCALAVMRLLDFHNIPVSGKRVAMLGRSNTVGSPLAKMLTCKNATVTLCHTKTENIADILKESDIVISATGRARFIKKEMLKKGTIIIDVGTNQDENGIFCGDADFDNIKEICSISPVPGGVGPVTLACLLENIVISAERKVK